MSKYYAVRCGITPGIYRDWDTAKLQVNGFKGAIYKGFKNETEAVAFMNPITNDDKNINDKTKNKVDKFIKPINIDTLVYTDGSSKNKVGGYGFVVLNLNDIDNIYKESCKIEGTCSNQKAELYAIYKVLLYLKNNNIHKRIMIRTDSQWTINTITVWIHNWMKKGFYTAKNEPVKYQELIIEIYQLLQEFNIVFEHVYSHEGEIYNEMVDKLAKLHTI